MFIFRPEELRQLKDHLGAPGPRAILVHGDRALGKTTLVRSALGDRPSIWLQGAQLPPPLLAWEHRVRVEGDGDVGAEDAARDTRPPETPWSGFGSALRRRMDRGTLDGVVVVWDRAEGLIRDPRWRQMLAALWTELRSRARPVHLVLISRQVAPPDALEFFGTHGGALARLALHPLGLRAATAGFEAWSPLRRLAAYALLGGEPTIWDRLDPQLKLSTNLHRLLLEPGAPLRHFIERRYPLPGRSPERAAALLHAMAHGARDWGELRAGARVFRTSSELGPYIQALRDVGLVEALRSLDARPEARNRRYVLRPALLQSWYALIRPHLAAIDGGGNPTEVWKEHLRPRIPDLVARRLPEIVSAYLREHGEESVRARARETGGLWGEGVDIPVAGILTNGSVVYASTSWSDPGEDGLSALERQVSETRYGYGRASRIVALFSARPVAWRVQRSVARRPEALLLRPSDLLGNAPRSGE